jgi:hypothetical protein
MNHHNKDEEVQLDALNSEMLSLIKSDEKELTELENEILKTYRENSRLNTLGFVGLTFLIAMSFIQMTFGALLILEQFPETNWVMSSVLAAF